MWCKLLPSSALQFLPLQEPIQVKDTCRPNFPTPRARLLILLEIVSDINMSVRLGKLSIECFLFQYKDCVGSEINKQILFVVDLFVVSSSNVKLLAWKFPVKVKCSCQELKMSINLRQEPILRNHLQRWSITTGYSRNHDMSSVDLKANRNFPHKFFASRAEPSLQGAVDIWCFFWCLC